MMAMIAAGAAGNRLGEVALHRTSEGRFHVLLRAVLTLLGLRLLWDAINNGALLR